MNNTDATLDRILSAFDVDFYTEYGGGKRTFVGRLWDEGEEIALCASSDVSDLIRDLDKNASAIANYG